MWTTPALYLAMNTRVGAEEILRSPPAAVTPSSVKEEGEEQEIDGGAGFISCSVNLLKACIGAGILAIPYAIGTLGWAAGILVLTFACGLSTLGLFLLTIVGYWHGRKSTFGSAAEKTFPKAAVLFDLTVVIKCLGVATAYLGNICKQIPSIYRDIMVHRGSMSDTDELPSWMTNNKVIWVAISLACLTPIVSFRKIDSLKYTSFFGLFSIFYLLVLSIYTFITTAVEGNLQPMQAFAPLSAKALASFPIFVFAFNCHQNVFPVQNEATKNTPLWMSRVILTVMISTLMIYVSFGVFSYGSFPNLQDDILASFKPVKVQYIIAKILFVVLLACSYPLQSFPCRAAMERIVSSLAPKFAETFPKTVYVGNTAVIILFTGFIASLNLGFGIVLKIIGSTAGPIICFFFPAFLYLKGESAAIKEGKKVKLWVRNAARALLVISFITTPLSLGLVIYEIVKPQ